jgi:hypothetical protein
VNGSLISAPTRLAPGDVVDVGGTSLLVQAEPTEQPVPERGPSRVPGTPSSLRNPLLPGGLLAALVLQLIFIASFVGALHDPTLHEVPFAVVGPSEAARAVARDLAARGDLVDPVVVESPAELGRAIDEREVYGGLVLGPDSDRLVVADAASIQISRALVEVFRSTAEQQGRRLTVAQVKPLPAGDSRGLSAFYAGIGWVFGGYLGATILSLLAGTASRSRVRAAMRIGALGAYALVAGVLGAVVIGPVLGALEGHFLAVAGLGALLVFAAAAATAGLQAVLGLAGTAIAMIAFFLLGNPSAGGAAPPELLPGFWHAIGPWLPPGAGFTAITNTVYFDANATGRSLAVLAGYAVVGSGVAVAIGWRRGRRTEPELELTTAAAAA